MTQANLYLPLHCLCLHPVHFSFYIVYLAGPSRERVRTLPRTSHHSYSRLIMQRCFSRPASSTSLFSSQRLFLLPSATINSVVAFSRLSPSLSPSLTPTATANTATRFVSSSSLTWSQVRFFSDSHDDFKPQRHMTESSEEAKELIKSDVSNNKVFLFMKGKAFRNHSWT